MVPLFSDYPPHDAPEILNRDRFLLQARTALTPYVYITTISTGWGS